MLHLTQCLMMQPYALLTFVFCLFFLALSGGDPEHQLRGDGAQFPVSTSPAPRLQAVLCVPGQILGVPLWCQLLRGLQGEKNLPDASDLYGVWIYCNHVARMLQGSVVIPLHAHKRLAGIRFMQV